MVTMSSVVLAIIGTAVGAILTGASFVLKQVITGDLVPRKALEDAIADATRAEAREERWRVAYEHSAETVRLLSEPMGRLATIGTTPQIIAAAALPTSQAAPEAGGTGVAVA